MKIKTFKGQKMSEILRTIRQELGAEAVILSTREIGLSPKGRKMMKHAGSRGGRTTFAFPVIEVTAATEPPEPVKPAEKAAPESFDVSLKQAVQGDIYKALQLIRTELSLLKKPDADSVSTPNPEISNASPKDLNHLIENAPSKKLHETWLEMKIMLKSMTEMRQENPVFPKNKTLYRLFEQLRLNGVDSETAMHLVKTVKARLPQEEWWEPDRVRHSLYGVVERLIKVTGPFVFDSPQSGGSAKVVALIGPTGVGKTTTAAKLGVYRKKRQKRVTLVSLDETESGGSDVLMQHANRHGVTGVKIGSWHSLRSLVSRREKGELILVDTAGRSHLKPEDVSDLKGLLSVGIGFEVHLVLSANTKRCDLSDMIDRFSVVPIDSLLFTKLDETQTYGSLFSAMGRKRKPISYLTMGRRVPEDIELATVKRFTDLVLSGGCKQGE